MIKRYTDKIHQYRIIFLLILIPIYIFLVPVGFNAYNHISPELGVEDLGTDQGVFTFTSLTDDIVIIFNGDQNIITQSFYDTLASIVFMIQTNPVIQQTAADAKPIEHIFRAAQQLLSDYYTQLYTTTGFGNVTTYILIELTRIIIDHWQSSSDNISTVISTYQPQFQADLDKLAYGSLSIFDSMLTNWMNLLSVKLATESKSYNYTDLVQSWNSNPQEWLPLDQVRYTDALTTLLQEIEPQTRWVPDDYLNLMADYLFGKNTTGGPAFLARIFNNGHDPTNAVLQAQQDLIPFIRTEYNPIGLPEDIRNSYLEAFTNSKGLTTPTALILRFQLSSDLDKEQLHRLLAEMKDLMAEIRTLIPDSYQASFLSLLNYQNERSQIISQEMHFVDITAVIIGFLILLFILKDWILSGLIISVAWLSTQVIRGFLVLFPFIQQVNGTSFSMATTFFLGAAMNYTVFFKFRYLEERDKKADHATAIENSTDTALHSVIISGIAIILSMIPYYNSNLEILGDLSLTIVVGLLVEIILLVHALPVIFGSLNAIQDRLQNTNFQRVPTFALHLDRKHVHRILLVTLVFAIISAVVIVSLDSSFVVNDIIGDTGETGRAMHIMEDNFPSNYLSQTLIKVHTNATVLQAGELNVAILDDIGELTRQISQLDQIAALISIAWPFGEPFNYSSTSIGQVQYQAAHTVSEQLIFNDTTTYIILSSQIASNSGKLADQVRHLREIIARVQPKLPSVDSIDLSGLPVQVEELTRKTASQLGNQILLALILITIFLTLVLKSVLVPIRLELSIMIASLYSIAIASLLFKVFTDLPLNILVISSSFLILLGLGTDFDIYLYRRIEEEKRIQQINFHEAIPQGVQKSAPAIVSSGLVMAFSFLSLLNSDISIVRQFGLVTFITIIIDIFVVRTLIVPAFLKFLSWHREFD